MAGDAPKLDQVKLARMQQSVRIGEFVMFLGKCGGGRENIERLGSMKTNCKFIL